MRESASGVRSQLFLIIADIVICPRLLMGAHSTVRHGEGVLSRQNSGSWFGHGALPGVSLFA